MLESASPGDPAVAAVTEAVHAVLAAVDDPDAAPGAAANAAQAAMFGAADCALLPLLSYAQRQAADSVREALPFEVVARAVDSA
jgi:hypothetical protein